MHGQLCSAWIPGRAPSRRRRYRNSRVIIQAVRHRISAGALLLRLALITALDPATLYAQGGPPMLTDDPDTPGSGNWEINLAYIEERNKLDQIRNFPHVDVNYGLGESIQLKFETGWVIADLADGGSRSGLDDSLIGLK